MNGGINIYKTRDLTGYSEKLIPIYPNNLIPRIFLQLENNWTDFKLRKLNYVEPAFNNVDVQNETTLSTSTYLNGTDTTYTIDDALTLESGLYDIELINTDGVYLSDVFKVYDFVASGDVIIGSQTWKAFNMSTNDEVGGLKYPNGDVDNVDGYGFLYNYAAAERIAATIDGYRLPTYTEMATLITYLGGASEAGGHMKEKGTVYWLAESSVADNSSGFGGRGSGYCLSDGTTFGDFKTEANFWTSSSIDGGVTAQTIGLRSSSDSILYVNSADKDSYKPVRLIKE
jgi:uncharacterized protein (TIGR02145 family)